MLYKDLNLSSKNQLSKEILVKVIKYENDVDKKHTSREWKQKIQNVIDRYSKQPEKMKRQVIFNEVSAQSIFDICLKDLSLFIRSENKIGTGKKAVYVYFIKIQFLSTNSPSG
jgi:hypothetical protein